MGAASQVLVTRAGRTQGADLTELSAGYYFLISAGEGCDAKCILVSSEIELTQKVLHTLKIWVST